ncbi:MAG: hypothetical protein PHI72_03335 [Atribacterota bacterium]|nr:hypothetical protein [Atribacterota bacterium]MDD4895811.1 hypothetical protein [Atribacterota bacterium]MDD5637442.1 hypothetical protein [Atribacterota bacterium]
MIALGFTIVGSLFGSIAQDSSMILLIGQMIGPPLIGMIISKGS